MRSTSLAAISAAFAIALCQSAAAEQVFRYDYIGVRYTKSSSDVPGFQETRGGSNYGVLGSAALLDMLALQASYSRNRSSLNIPGVTSQSFSGRSESAGFDLHTMIGKATEIGLDWSRNHSTGASTVDGVARPSTTGNSNSYTLRVRTAVSEKFWLQAQAGRTTGWNSTATTDYNVNGEYFVGRDVGLRVNLGFANTATGNNTRSAAVSGRYYF